MQVSGISNWMFDDVWIPDPQRATSTVATRSVYGLAADWSCGHRLASFHEVMISDLYLTAFCSFQSN